MNDGRLAATAGMPPLSAFSERLAQAGQSPGADAMRIAVSHLHALVAELRPSPEVLRNTLDFLTEVGHMSDHRRQEWVLLADVLGVSTLVEDMAHRRPPGATPNTLPGPFYRADVPETGNGANLSLDGRGAPLAVTGQVTALDGSALGGALVEVWHANGEGLYENQEPDRQPEFNLRGRMRADDTGRFAFRTIKPRGYRLPEDGPVGRLMNGLGLRLERPAHLHFRITAPGHEVLTTHVFDRDDPAIDRDALFGVKPELLGWFRPAGAGWELDVTFVLAPAGAGKT